MMIFSFFWKLSPSADLEDLFCSIHTCPFFIQMSEFLYFSSPKLEYDDFRHF